MGVHLGPYETGFLRLYRRGDMFRSRRLYYDAGPFRLGQVIGQVDPI